MTMGSGNEFGMTMGGGTRFRNEFGMSMGSGNEIPKRVRNDNEV